MNLSIVIPVYNEQDSLAELLSEVVAECDPDDRGMEIIFVDDGSTDRSWSEIEALSAADPRVRGLRLRRNFGKAAALSAGVRAATGDIIVQMDADLQDDPREVPRMLSTLQNGYDLVNGWKQRRLDPWHKVYPSKLFNAMVSRLSGVSLHDHNCGLKAYRAKVVEEIRLYGEMHRFIPVMAASRGFRIAEQPVHHRERQHGQSKYGVRRFLKGFLDLLTVTFLTSFGLRPQHIIGAFGLASFAIGMAGLLYLGGLWSLMHLFEVVAPASIGTRPLLAYSTLLTVLGVHAVSLGLIAEMVVARSLNAGDVYSISGDTLTSEHATHSLMEQLAHRPAFAVRSENR